MAIKKYFAIADNTITNAYKLNLSTRATGSNAGAADVMEIFSIYGRQSTSSAEISRALVKFPISEITTDRNNAKIPGSGSVKFYLKLHNAEHSKTVPSGNFGIVAEPLSTDWEEGFGLDLEGYKDSTNGNVGSNWIVRKGEGLQEITKVTFSSATKTDYGAGSGANYIIAYNGNRRYNLWFNDGSGDTAPDATGAEVEIDLSSTAASIAGIAAQFQSVTNALGTFDSNVDPSNSAIVYLSSSLKGGHTDTSVEGTLSGIALAVQQDGNNEIPWTKVGGDYITTANAAYPYRWFSQSFYTGLEDLEIDITQMVELWAAGTVDNYGLGIHLTGTAEPFFSTDFDPTYTGYIQNTTGSTVSYYTKRFFTRGTQYFYKRPAIEARWDSSKKDDRGQIFYSSSLAGTNDNLNTLYLYNYVRGQLENIPTITSPGAPNWKGNIYVSFYSGSADNSKPTGSLQTSSYTPNPPGGHSRAAIRLPDTLPHTHVSVANPLVVTGGWVSKGVYTASFTITGALNSSSADLLTTIFDVWHDGAGNSAGTPWSSVEFATSSFEPTNISASNSMAEPVYHLNITNLKDNYRSNENARFNLFVRNKNWEPTIYTVANSDVENSSIASASYAVHRLIDGFEAVPYGTGSQLHTMLSYDMSGNYFDFDMNLLEPGYAYAFKFSFYDNSLNSWVEQPHVFKFRVEDYEY
jgi:hypothetical protein